MKIASNKLGLGFRLGALATVLLFGQQAMAEGTRAGTSITNTATVDYAVGGIDQNDITSDPATATFLVDRRVNVVLVPASTGTLVTVNPGTNDYWVDFLLTNNSNDVLDFTVAVAEVSPSDGTIDVDGQGGDTGDMGTLDYAIAGPGDTDPTRGAGAQYVDDLAADDSIRIRVFGDAALTMLDGQIAGAELTVTAADPSGTPAAQGAALDFTVANTAGGVENVDVYSNDGVVVSIDGFIVESAAITISKAYTVVDDGYGGTYLLPGAVLEYTVTLENTGAAQATDVVVTDTLDSNLEFVASGVSGNDMTVDDGSGATGCSAAANGDGCLLSGQDLTFDNITLDAGDTYVFTWRVTIADPDPTPAP
jgi:uncharacterized repeat protein (TIGR01451 family)